MKFQGNAINAHIFDVTKDARECATGFPLTDIQHSMNAQTDSHKKTKNMEQIKVEMKPIGLEMTADRNDFALALKTWRLRSGLTQRQVAQKFKCSRYTIMDAENGKKVSWEMAYRLFARLADELRKEANDEKQV